MIRAILFDLDGTLVNTNNLILQSFKHAFRKGLNLDVPDAEIIKEFGVPLTKSMGKYGEENVERLIQIFREFNESKHDELASGFVGVEEALIKLKKLGIKIAIVTSKRRPMALRSLKLIGIYDYIDVMVTPEDTEKHKPDAEPALRACELLGVKAEEAVMVGDSIYDILCGKNAGCRTCAVTYSEFPQEELEKCSPDYIVDNLLELVEILFKGEGETAV